MLCMNEYMMRVRTAGTGASAHKIITSSRPIKINRLSWVFDLCSSPRRLFYRIRTHSHQSPRLVAWLVVIRAADRTIFKSAALQRAAHFLYCQFCVAQKRFTFDMTFEKIPLTHFTQCKLT